MRRLAWFSPMPPARTGVAGRSAELVAALAPHFEIAVFDARSAHDFLWRHHRRPFDLTVFQLGNSSAHEFVWPYLFRFPGLAVLHDGHLHHARAWTLLRHGRRDDYRAEFAACHPDASPDLAEMAVYGFENHFYYLWPLTRLAVLASRLTAVHAPRVRESLTETMPGAAVEVIRLGEGVPLGDAEKQAARSAVRARHHIADTSIVFGVFGGLTPEKRIPQILAAFSTLLSYHPDAHLLLVGAPADHYDARDAIRAAGAGANVTVTGFVGDEAFTGYLAACDVSLNLRWPTAREMSGPWLRALAARVPTITTALAHLVEIPAYDPRAWAVTHACGTLERVEPVTVAIDILDEQHSLQLALARLAADAVLRRQLAHAGFAYWAREHAFERMVDDYLRVIDRALAAPQPSAPLPSHLRQTGDEHLRRLLTPFEFEQTLWSTI